MLGDTRSRIGLVLVLVAGGVAFVGTRLGAGATPGAGQPGSGTEAKRTEIEAAIADLRRSAETSAKRAAGVAPLRAALASRVDVATLVDLISTEDWWLPLREAFPTSRVSLGAEVASHGPLPLTDEDRRLAGEARRKGSASAIAKAGGRPLIMAAARVDEDREGPVVILVRPFDTVSLKDLSERSRQTVMLADDKNVLDVALTSGTDRSLIETLAGRTDDSVIDPEGRFVAFRTALGTGLHLWALTAVAPGSLRKTAPPAPIFWGVAGIVAAAGLALILVRRKPGTPRPTPESSPLVAGPNFAFAGAQPSFSDPSLARVSTGSSVSGMAIPGSGAFAPGHNSSGTLPAAGSSGSLAQSPGNETAPGTFGRYQLLHRIADGGMSEIYTAISHGAEGFTRRFVIKRLRPSLRQDKEAVSQFIDEARVQASLVHPNIVPVFDFGTMGDEYFMTQEYIVGRDLYRITDRCLALHGKPMPPRVAYHAVHQALEALAFAHTKSDRDGSPAGIVHRDVSTGNIMVSAEGDVKLFDFGIAKSNRRVTQTAAGMVKGNARFMAPEQARGQPVDPRSDLFSLGLVIYYCLAGDYLYDGANDLDVLFRAACGPTEDDLKKVDALPGPIAAMVRKAIDMNPDARFQTAAEFAEIVAPLAMGARQETSNLMKSLFAEELRRESA